MNLYMSEKLLQLFYKLKCSEVGPNLYEEFRATFEALLQASSKNLDIAEKE